MVPRAPFFKTVISHGKHVIAVLKDDRRELLQDAMSIFSQEQPVIFRQKAVTRRCWDMEGFTTWTQFKQEVRVVRSIETATVCRKMTGKKQDRVSDWMWVTTLPKQRVSRRIFVDIAHRRWDIENKAFNEMATYWCANHVYKHTASAIEAFWLITMLVYNFFHVFITLNLKPEIRYACSKLHLARTIAAELYAMNGHFLSCRSP